MNPLKTFPLLISIFLLSACTPEKAETNLVDTRKTITATSSIDKETDLPKGYWRLDQTQPIIDQTAEITLSPDISILKPAEKNAIKELMLAGIILNDLYEQQRHPEALAARANLAKLHAGSKNPAATQALTELYYQAKGPIIRDLDGKRKPFLPVAGPRNWGNVYPWDLHEDNFSAYLEANPEQRESLKHVRSVVRKVTPSNLALDIAKLENNPELDNLHKGLKDNLKLIQNSRPAEAYYALPYSVHYDKEVQQVVNHLRSAAKHIESEDEEFSVYLLARADDMLRDDYLTGDEAWVTGRYQNLNAQIGSYETYDDAFLGVKSFFSLNVLLKNQEASETLAQGVAGLQAIHDALPYSFPRKINTNLSLGVYDVVADFGQSRGSNTATILPNEAEQSRRFGRTIMLRHNIMTNQTLFDNTQAAFAAVVSEEQAQDLSVDGQFQRTLWHEVGHYLGVDQTLEGDEIDSALQEVSDLYEEMKADLVSLFSAYHLNQNKQMDDKTFRSIQAGGIRRVLLKNKPERSSPYGTMMLMQFNYFRDKGVLSFDEDNTRLTIAYDKFPGVVNDLLGKVLAIQAAGDKVKAKAFVEQWGDWKPEVHGSIAKKMNAASQFRYTRVKYTELERLLAE